MFKIVSTQDELDRALLVRGIVFIEDNAIPYRVERDRHDFSAIHVLGEENGEPVAAARIRVVDGFAKLERIAVRRAYRGKNIGHGITDFLISVARSAGIRKCKLHAQSHLVDFYRAHGFEKVGELFQEAGIDHYLMIRHDE